MQDTNPPQPTESMIGKLLVASTTVNDPLLSRAVCLVVHQDSENVFAVLLNRPMTPPPGLVKLLDAGSGPLGSTNNASNHFGSHRLSGKFNENPTPFPTNLPGPESVSPSLGDSADQVNDDSADESTEQAMPKHSLAEHAAAEASKALGTIHFGGPLSGPLVAVHDSSEYAEAEAGKGIYVAAQREMLETLVKQNRGSFRLIVGHLGWSIEQLRSERQAGFWHMIDATDEDIFVGDQDLWPSLIRRATSASVANWLGIKDTACASQVN
jgi:putative transcriptional regulator